MVALYSLLPSGHSGYGRIDNIENWAAFALLPAGSGHGWQRTRDRLSIPKVNMPEARTPRESTSIRNLMALVCGTWIAEPDQRNTD